MGSRSAFPLSLINLRVLEECQFDGELEWIPSTHSNSFARHSCSSSSQGASPSSSEHSRFNRAITESSLFFTPGDFCSSVSECRCELVEFYYLMKFQKGVEGSLDERTDCQRKKIDKSESPHSEVGDLVIDRLLLRHLPFCLNRIRRNRIAHIHLRVGNSLSESIDESCHLFGILPLIHEPGGDTLLQQRQ